MEHGRPAGKHRRRSRESSGLYLRNTLAVGQSKISIIPSDAQSVVQSLQDKLPRGILPCQSFRLLLHCFNRVICGNRMAESQICELLNGIANGRCTGIVKILFGLLAQLVDWQQKFRSQSRMV